MPNPEDNDIKRDEEQEVRDADVDTRDVENTVNQDTEDEQHGINEISRKLDGIVESIGILSKGFAQFLTSNTVHTPDPDAGTGGPRTAPAPDSPVSIGASLAGLDFKMD